MEGVTERKTEQMQICSTMEVEVGENTIWDEMHLIHKCLPEINRDEIDLSVLPNVSH